jgi:hypothetical protein
VARPRPPPQPRRRASLRAGHGLGLLHHRLPRGARAGRSGGGMPLGEALRRSILAPVGLGGARLAVERADLVEVAMGPAAAGYHPGWVYHGLLVVRLPRACSAASYSGQFVTRCRCRGMRCRRSLFALNGMPTPYRRRYRPFGAYPQRQAGAICAPRPIRDRARRMAPARSAAAC